MAEAVCDLFTRAGLPDVHLVDVGGGHPTVYADVPGPIGSPTVLLYGHYDVQPAAMDQGWTTDLDAHEAGRSAVRPRRGGRQERRPHPCLDHSVVRWTAPVGLKLVIEGEEETFSHLEAFVEERPDLFKADVMVLHEHRPVEVQRGATRVRVSRPFIVGMGGSAVSDARVALAAPTVAKCGPSSVLAPCRFSGPSRRRTPTRSSSCGARTMRLEHPWHQRKRDPSEIELMALAQAILIESVAARGRSRRSSFDRLWTTGAGRSDRTGRVSSGGMPAHW